MSVVNTLQYLAFVQEVVYICSMSAIMIWMALFARMFIRVMPDIASTLNAWLIYFVLFTACTTPVVSVVRFILSVINFNEPGRLLYGPTTILALRCAERGALVLSLLAVITALSRRVLYGNRMPAHLKNFCWSFLLNTGLCLISIVWSFYRMAWLYEATRTLPVRILSPTAMMLAAIVVTFITLSVLAFRYWLSHITNVIMEQQEGEGQQVDFELEHLQGNGEGQQEEAEGQQEGAVDNPGSLEAVRLVLEL